MKKRKKIIKPETLSTKCRIMFWYEIEQAGKLKEIAVRHNRSVSSLMGIIADDFIEQNSQQEG